jgi:long-chain acyl-CoA synthetase
MEVRIDADGEVLIRSGGVFKGYYNQPESTAAAVLPEGWFRTGDAGFLDPRGHLVIVDRAKDVGKLADGSVFAPQFVENKLKFSPFIAEAVAFGHERPFVAAMIAIDAGTVGNWAERRGLPYTSFQDLSAKPAVRALIREEIRKCNNGLPEAARVRRFLLLTKALEADDAEVTRTRKIRRRFVAEKYAAVVDAFYGAASEVELEIEITYDDGRGDRIRSVVPIEEAEAPSVVSRAPELAHA